MQGEISVGDQRISYEFVEKQSVRNIYLKFYGEKLVIVAPKRLFRPERPESIIAKHKDWIAKHHQIVKNRRQIFDKNYVSYLGKRYLTVFAQGSRKVEVGRDAIVVHAETREAADALVEAMIKRETKELLPRITLEKARQLGERVNDIKFRRGRRWGCCTSRRDITFNSYLSALPIEAIDYVASHEVAHLREMNHSPAFWAVVATLCPEYRRLRKLLADYDNDSGHVML